MRIKYVHMYTICIRWHQEHVRMHTYTPQRTYVRPLDSVDTNFPENFHEDIFSRKN